MPGEQYRLAQQYDTAYVDYLHTWRFLVEEVVNDAVVPFDLTGFDEVRLQIYLDDAAPTLISDEAATVLIGAEDLEEGVPARCEVSWTAMSGDFTPDTEYRAKLVGVAGATKQVIEKPWLFQAFSAGAV